jgi:hypothetical protein
MTSPSVVQRLSGAASARATTFTATFSAATAGNLLVLEMNLETNNSGPAGPPSGWTTGILNTTDGQNNTSIFYKIAAGGETSVSPTFGNNTWTWVFREISGGTAITFGTSATGTSANPDPPSVTGAATNDYLWIAGSGYKTTTTSSYSSGYSNGLTASSTGNLVRLASAEKQSNGISEDAGTLTLGASANWIAFSYGIQSLYSNIVGSSTLTFSQSGTAKGNTALIASSTLTFSQSAVIKGNTSLVASSSLTFSQTGTIKGNTALVGSSSLTFTNTSTLKGTGLVIASSTLTFSPSAVISSLASIIGSSTLTFSATGTGRFVALLVGNTTLNFATTGILVGTASISGSITYVFDVNGSLVFIRSPYEFDVSDPSGPIYDTSDTEGNLYEITTGDGYGIIYEED